MPCVVVAGRRGLKGREWMPEGKRYTATAQDGVEAIGQCTKNSHQEGGKEHGRKDNCHVHGSIFTKRGFGWSLWSSRGARGGTCTCIVGHLACVLE